MVMKKKEIGRVNKYDSAGFKNDSLENYLQQPDGASIEIDFFSCKQNTIGKC